MASLGVLPGVLGALYERERSGRGQKVTTSHYQVGVWINSFLIDTRFAGGDIEARAYHWASPTRAFYQCADGRWLLIAGLHDGHWQATCRAIEREDLLADERFCSPRDRINNAEALVPILREAFLARPAKEWTERMGKAGAVCEMAYEVDDVIADPIAEQNDFWTEIDTELGPRRSVACPVQFSRTPARPRGPVPEMGQHTEEVLVERGYSWEQIGALRDAGII
jgi:formyl-CoA transferase